MREKLIVMIRHSREGIVEETAVIESVYARDLYDSDEPEQLLLSWMDIKPVELRLKEIVHSSERRLSQITYEYKNPMWE